MQTQHDASNPSGFDNDEEGVVIETVCSESSGGRGQVQTSNDTEARSISIDQTQGEEEADMEEGSDASQEEPRTPIEIPSRRNTPSGNQPRNFHQEIPIQEEGTLDIEIPGFKTITDPQDDATDERPQQTIVFEDAEPYERPARRSTTTMQDLIHDARRTSTANFQSPPLISRLSHQERLVNATPFMTPVNTADPEGGGSPSSGSSSTDNSRGNPPDPDQGDGPDGPGPPPPPGNPDGSSGPPSLEGTAASEAPSDQSEHPPNSGPPIGSRPSAPRIRCLKCDASTHSTTYCPYDRPIPLCLHCNRKHLSIACPAMNKDVNPYDVIVDGRKLSIRSAPVSVHNYVRRRNWNKLTRWKLTAEDRIAFDTKASGYALHKGNKLRVQSQFTEDEDILKNIHNLQYQIKALKNHVTEYDMLDVFTVVVPKDIHRTPELVPISYNLFDDYPKLTPELVGNSNAYYSRWISDEYIPENLNLTYTLFKNNADDNLFNKCLEEYETFHPMQRGGPLILCLILQKVHNASEQHLEHLQGKVETLNISKMKGENVDTAVSLISAAHEIFISSSTPEHNRAPPEWSKTLIKVFKTTSVDEFTQTFKDEEKDARRDADKNGGQPSWPTHAQLVRLATITYNRLKRSGHWDVPQSSKAKSYISNSGGTPYNSKSNMNYHCWNCGKPDHRLNDCTAPRDEARIERERTQFRAKRGNSGGGGRGGRFDRNPRRPPFKKMDGKPMVLNRKGAYVLDQKKVQSQRKQTRVDQALAALNGPTRPAPAPPPPSTPQALLTEDRTYDPYKLQSILREIL